MIDWGVGGDGGWGEEALQGAYPTLPKSFTNAKTAKKRKHKELFVREEDLDKPVRLQKKRQHKEERAPAAVDADANGARRLRVSQTGRRCRRRRYRCIVPRLRCAAALPLLCE